MRFSIMGFDWKQLSEIECSEITEENFWNGICVWIERPHLLNRRLLAAEVLEARIVHKTDKTLNEHVLKLFIMKNLNFSTLQNMLQNSSLPNELFKPSNNFKIIESLISNKADNENSEFLIIRNLLSRNMKLYQDMAEVLLLDKSDCSVTFYPLTSDILIYPLSPSFPYRIKLESHRISLEIFRNWSEEKHADDYKTEKWLASDILPKVYKWCRYQPENPVVPSLNLISAKQYNINLHHLKEKYGKFYVEIWPFYNTTDPLKFVYEDISICAYLITLWEEERTRLNCNQKQKFVDLGCGNGLLVDILISEGYDGIGIDIRRRKIWEAFKSKNKLIEMAIEPCNQQLFPEYDWLIGNHPDELTPWIPIIAARSSYQMKIFLMPCCYYTFNGKYARCDAGLTRYQSYLKFIQNICEEAGFKVQQDKLRIPSTKRTCLICTSRSYDEEEETNVDLRRNNLINYKLKSQQIPSKNCYKISFERDQLSCTFSESSTTNKWTSDFKPREQVEPVRNCTDLNRKLLDDIVSAVVNILLSKQDFKLLERDCRAISWNAGGVFKLEDLIKSMNPNLLNCLKRQNGGFQTLLRNHRNIFELKNGYVQIRVPEKCPCMESPEKRACFCQRKNSLVYKSKNCFFHFNHPQGCPLTSSECSFSHENLSSGEKNN